jgi:hypothetical protein
MTIDKQFKIREGVYENFTDANGDQGYSRVIAGWKRFVCVPSSQLQVKLIT